MAQSCMRAWRAVCLATRARCNMLCAACRGDFTPAAVTRALCGDTPCDRRTKPSGHGAWHSFPLRSPHSMLAAMLCWAGLFTRRRQLPALLLWRRCGGAGIMRPPSRRGAAATARRMHVICSRTMRIRRLGCVEPEVPQWEPAAALHGRRRRGGCQRRRPRPPCRIAAFGTRFDFCYETCAVRGGMQIAPAISPAIS